MTGISLQNWKSQGPLNSFHLPSNYDLAQGPVQAFPKPMQTTQAPMRSEIGPMFMD